MEQERILAAHGASGFGDGYEQGPRPPWHRGPERRPYAPAAAPLRLPMSFTEADKFRWIVANRGSFDLLDALRHATCDADFDALLESAMRMSAAAPSYFGDLGDLPHV